MNLRPFTEITVKQLHLLQKTKVTRLHSSRMRTAHSLAVCHCVLLGRGLPNPSLRMQTPEYRPPWDADPAPPPVDRMTDTCKNITLPQTSFAGGKKRNGFPFKRGDCHKTYSERAHKQGSSSFVQAFKRCRLTHRWVTELQTVNE